MAKRGRPAKKAEEKEIKIDHETLEAKEVSKKIINVWKDGLNANIPEDQFKLWEKSGWSKQK